MYVCVYVASRDEVLRSCENSTSRYWLNVWNFNKAICARYYLCERNHFFFAARDETTGWSLRVDQPSITLNAFPDDSSTARAGREVQKKKVKVCSRWKNGWRRNKNTSRPDGARGVHALARWEWARRKMGKYIIKFPGNFSFCICYTSFARSRPLSSDRSIADVSARAHT